MSLLLIWIGGVTGAWCRYHVGRVVQQGKLYPAGTLAVNISGSLALGLITGQLAQVPSPQRDQLALLLGVGFCGAYTTFSTFAWETVELWRRQHYWYVLLHVCVQPLVACVATWIALMIG